MTAVAEKANHVTITDAGPCQKKVAIRIPADVVRSKIEASVQSAASTMQFKGFRPGKAPKAFVQKKVGTGLWSDAKKELAMEAFGEAVKEHKLKVVGDPLSQDLAKAEFKEGDDLAFEIDVEVVPDFTLPKWDGVEVMKPLLPVTDEMVNDEVERARVNEGDLESRDVPEFGDYITGHAIMTGPEGKEFYNLNGAVVQIPTADKNGKGMILGVLVEDFSKQIGLPKVGDKKTIKMTGPEHHEVEAIRNAPLTVTFEVQRIDRIIPAALDALVARYGFENADLLKATVRTRLEQRVGGEQQTAMRQQVAIHLLRATKMELPKRLTAGQAGRLLERQRLELMYRGTDPNKIEERMAEMRRSTFMNAAAELKLFFILSTIAEEMKIGITEGELNGLISQMAREQNTRPNELREQLIKSGRINMLAQQLREYKTLDAIIAKATIAEKSKEEFEAAMKAMAEKKD